MLLRYSRGDAIRELAQYFPGLLTYWEQSNQVFTELGKDFGDRGRWDRAFLNWYQISFWLVGLALTLTIPADQWQRGKRYPARSHYCYSAARKSFAEFTLHRARER